MHSRLSVKWNAININCRVAYWLLLLQVTLIKWFIININMYTPWMKTLTRVEWQRVRRRPSEARQTEIRQWASNIRNLRFMATKWNVFACDGLFCSMTTSVMIVDKVLAGYRLFVEGLLRQWKRYVHEERIAVVLLRYFLVERKALFEIYISSLQISSC